MKVWEEEWFDEPYVEGTVERELHTLTRIYAEFLRCVKHPSDKAKLRRELLCSLRRHEEAWTARYEAEDEE